MCSKSCTEVVLVALLAYPAGFGLRQAQGLKKIRWGQTSIGASQWIPWIAKDAKIYEKNGLDMEIILLRGSGQTSQAMIGGSIFASPVTTATLMTANLERRRSDQRWPIPLPPCRAKCW